MASVLDFDVDCEANKEQFLFNNDYHHLSANFTYDIMSDVSSTFGKFDNIIYQTKTRTSLDTPEPIPEYTPVEWEDDKPVAGGSEKYPAITGAANTVIVINTTYGKTFTFYAYNTVAKTFTINWGDGKTESISLTRSVIKKITHDYSSSPTGEYTITIPANIITQLGINTATAQNGNIVAVRGIGNGITSLSTASFYNETHMEAFHCCDNTTIKNFTDVFVKNNTITNNGNSWNIIDRITLSGCTVLTEFPFYKSSSSNIHVYFPKLKKLSKYSFANCLKIASIDISRTSITEIDDYAFANNTELTNLICYAPVSDSRCNNLIRIGHCAFTNCGFVRFGTTSRCSPIYNSVYSSTTSEIVIENDAFFNCANLKSTTQYAFDNASDKFMKLEFLPETLTTITQNAITYNNGIQSIKLPTQLTAYQSVNTVMFSNCHALTSITYNDIPQTSFLPARITNGIAWSCSGLKLAIIPPTVTSLSTNSTPFKLCGNIETIIFPDGLSSITAQNVMPALGCKNLKVPFIGLTRYGTKGYGTANSVSADSANKLMGALFDKRYIEIAAQYYQAQQCYQSNVGGAVKLDTARAFPNTLTNLSVGAFLWLHSGAFSNMASLQTITFTQPPVDTPEKWSGLSAFYGCHSLVSVIFENMKHTLFENYGFSEASYNANKFPPMQGATEKHLVRYVFADGYYEWDSPNSKYKFYTFS